MEWQMWFTLVSVGLMFVMLAKTRIPPSGFAWEPLLYLWSREFLRIRKPWKGPPTRACSPWPSCLSWPGRLRKPGPYSCSRFFYLPGSKPHAVALIRMMAPVTVLSAFLNNTPVVAIFIPAVKAWAKKIKVPVSKLMIPLSYAAVFGGTCTLIGTSTNLVVSGVIQKELGVQIGLFEIAKVGVPFALIMFVVVTLLSLWLLPDRSSAIEQMGDPKAIHHGDDVSPGKRI